jgi:hypothetical protein
MKGGRAQRMKRREYARSLEYLVPRQCPRCGGYGHAHFVPPSLGEAGYWIRELVRP